MAAEPTPCCEFAWISDSGFDFIAVERSLSLVKETVGARSLVSVTLEGKPGDPSMMVFFRLSSRAYSSQLRKVMGMESLRLRCRALDLLLLSKGDLEGLHAKRAQLPVKTELAVDISKGVREFQLGLGLKPAVPPPVRLRLTFETTDALCALYAQQAAEGAVTIPGKAPPKDTQLRLELEVAGQDSVDSEAQVLELTRATPAGSFRAKLNPSPALRDLVTRHALRKREGRPAQGSGSESGRPQLRSHPRFETFLDVEFKELPELSAEYATNISKGGLFVRTARPPALRSKVKLRLKLPSGELLETEAEVVHAVSVEDAAARGGVAGVGLSFATGRPEFDEKISVLLDSYGRRKPLVLVVDSDRKFVAALREEVQKQGMEVEVATEGGEAIRKVMDRLFELDLLVLDLGQEEMGGAQLLHRIRHLGGEMDLPVLAFSVAPPGSVNEWLPKSTPLSQVLARIKSLARSRSET